MKSKLDQVRSDGSSGYSEVYDRSEEPDTGLFAVPERVVVPRKKRPDPRLKDLLEIHRKLVHEDLGKPDGELVQVFEGAKSNADHGLPDIPWNQGRKDGIYYRLNMKYLFGCGPVEFSKKVGCTSTMAYFFQSGHKGFSRTLLNYVGTLYNVSPATLRLLSNHAKHERFLAENGLDEPCVIPEYLMHYFEPYLYKKFEGKRKMTWKLGRKPVKVNSLTWMMQKAESVPFENRLAFIQAMENSYLYRQHVKSGGKIPDTETGDTTT